MASVQPILAEQDYARALARIYELFHAEPGTPESDEMDALCDLVEAYEAIHYPIPAPSPTEAIECRIEDLGLSKNDLIPCIGSREDVTDVLAGQREITPEIAQALHQLLGIDTELLLQEPAAPRG